MKCRLLLILFGIALVSGCAQSMKVRVVDWQTEEPIPSAKVVFSHVKKPYFITGSVVFDRCASDSQGYVTLTDRTGRIDIEANGYSPFRVAGEFGESMWVWLQRKDEAR